MKVRQLSVFLENQSGRLAEISGALADADVNIRSLSLADTSGFGILRLIVDDVDRALEVLRERGFTVRETEVVAVEMPDRPGGLASILRVLGEAGINIEYMHAFPEKSSTNAVVIFRFENPDDAIAALQSRGVRVMTARDVYAA